jgi:hypothetical protein
MNANGAWRLVQRRLVSLLAPFNVLRSRTIIAMEGGEDASGASERAIQALSQDGTGPAPVKGAKEFLRRFLRVPSGRELVRAVIIGGHVFALFLGWHDMAGDILAPGAQWIALVAFGSFCVGWVLLWAWRRRNAVRRPELAMGVGFYLCATAMLFLLACCHA